MKEVTKTVFVAEDGTEFTSAEQCQEYEEVEMIGEYIDKRVNELLGYWEDVSGATIVQWLLEEYTITKK